MSTPPVRTVRWRRLDGPGMETCELAFEAGAPSLRGTAAGAVSGKPFVVRYRVDCDAAWRTRRVEVVIEAAGGGKQLLLEQTEEGGWSRDGAACPALDVDLAFTPSTHTLPLRRFALEVGQLGSTRVAWVQFPSLEVRPVDQQYRRIALDRYRYRSGDAKADFKGGFRTVLTVGADGLVTDFPGFWQAAETA